MLNVYFFTPRNNSNMLLMYPTSSSTCHLMGNFKSPLTSNLRVPPFTPCKNTKPRTQTTPPITTLDISLANKMPPSVCFVHTSCSLPTLKKQSVFFLGGVGWGLQNATFVTMCKNRMTRFWVYSHLGFWVHP